MLHFVALLPVLWFSGCICGTKPPPGGSYQLVDDGSKEEALEHADQWKRYNKTRRWMEEVERTLSEVGVACTELDPVETSPVGTGLRSSSSSAALTAPTAGAGSSPDSPAIHTESTASGEAEIIDECPLGGLWLRTHMGSTKSSNLFTAQLLDDKDRRGRHVVVKYSNDCWSLMNTNGGPAARHPLFKEALFLFTLYATGLVPNPIFLSDPTVLTFGATLPTRVITPYLQEHMEACVCLGTKSHYLVMERAGMDLRTYFERLTPKLSWLGLARRAVTLTIAIVRRIRELHDNGVVHGAIRGSNILFKSRSDGQNSVEMHEFTELVFIDFDKAVFFPDQLGSPDKAPREPSPAPTRLSPWQLAGYRLGRRDDLYGALEFMANVLSRGATRRIIQDRMAEQEAITGAKLSDEFIGSLKPVRKVFANALDDMDDGVAREVVRAELDAILVEDLLGSCDHPDSRPPYHRVIRHLEKVVELL